MAERTMRVQGKGKASAPPDLVTLHFDVSGWDGEYGPAIEVLNERVDSLRGEMIGLGIARDQLKTARFRVNPTYEKVSRLGVEQRRLNGYTASHSVRLELPMEEGRLNAVLAAVTQSVSEPSISIAFEVDDTSGLRQRALEAAVAEATRNAETLAEASGVRLGTIQSLEYGWAEVRVTTTRYALEPPAPAVQAAPDIEPEEVEASESVTMTWQIG